MCMTRPDTIIQHLETADVDNWDETTNCYITKNSFIVHMTFALYEIGSKMIFLNVRVFTHQMGELYKMYYCKALVLTASSTKSDAPI